MTWDEKDRALLAASALIGYCRFVSSLRVSCRDEREMVMLDRWMKRLIEYADRAATSIDAALGDTTDSNGGKP